MALEPIKRITFTDPDKARVQSEAIASAESFTKRHIARYRGITVPLEAATSRPTCSRKRDELGRGASIGTMASIQGGLPDGLAAVRKHFGDAVQLIVQDASTPDARRTLVRWHCDRKAIVSKSTSVLSRSSSAQSAKALSVQPTASKPSATPQTLEEWLDESTAKMEELGRNETLRREIARKLS